jgi:hypothetical protein
VLQSLDERDYREKNNWRRWVWNRIEERLDGNLHEKTAVYLAGEENLDAQVAIKKGFSACNLVAVDKSQAKVSAMRRAGVLAICDDVFRVIREFPKPIDVINLDFCCGLTLPILQDLCALQTDPNSRNAIFALNFLRGRDASSNDARAELGCKTKHRGVMCFFALGKLLKFTDTDLAQSTTLHRPVDPIKTQYRSSTFQTFDTVVFRGFGHFLLPDNDAISQYPASADATRRKIAAYRAHQTRRRVRAAC